MYSGELYFWFLKSNASNFEDMASKVGEIEEICAYLCYVKSILIKNLMICGFLRFCSFFVYDKYI